MALRSLMPNRTTRTHLAFLALPVVLFVTFYIYPIISSIHLSLHSWDGFSPAMRWVGLQNYATLLSQPRFINAVFNNITWVVFMLVVPTGIGLLLASLLDRGMRGESIFRIIFFLPFTIPAVAVAAIWRWMYEPSNGLLTTVLNLIGLGGLSQNWLGIPMSSIFRLWARLPGGPPVSRFWCFSLAFATFPPSVSKRRVLKVLRPGRPSGK